MTEELPVHLYGIHVGVLRRESASTVTFRATADASNRFGLGSPMLSESLPFEGRSSTPEAATAYFGGLLPEGRGLTNMARQAGCPSDDVYRLIEFSGRDVAGAVSIGEPLEQRGGYQALDTAGIEVRLDRINDYAMGAMGGGGSLSGFQPKTTLARQGDSWAAGVDGAPSTHILKPITPDSEATLHAEAYTLALAREMDLNACESWVERFGQRLVLVIERYDRRIAENGSIERIHQEDAAQALGLPWHSDAKFESVDARASLRSVAGLLRRRKSVFGRGVDDRERLLAYTAFNVAVGNTDAHAKNFSTLHLEDGSIQLAPLYDISTHAFTFSGNRNMAMRIAGQKYQPHITRSHLCDEAQSWGLKETDAIRIIDDTLESLRYAVEDVDPGEASEKLGVYISTQTQNLLEGNSAGSGITGQPELAKLTKPQPMPVRQNRVDKGVPSGGQFSGRNHAEPGIRLDSGSSAARDS